MALNIKDRETERLAAEVATLTGQSKTGAIRRALQEQRQRLAFQVVPQDRRQDLQAFLEREVWPTVPRGVLGRRVSRRLREQILGYGRDGV